jgi:hypothetical protein
MELMMLQGKDVNIVELFYLFKTIHEKADFKENCPSNDWFDFLIQERFNEALG